MLLLKTHDKTSTVRTPTAAKKQQLPKSKLFQSDVLPLTVGETIANFIKPNRISKRSPAQVIYASHGCLLTLLNTFLIAFFFFISFTVKFKYVTCKPMVGFSRLSLLVQYLSMLHLYTHMLKWDSAECYKHLNTCF